MAKGLRAELETLFFEPIASACDRERNALTLATERTSEKVVLVGMGSLGGRSLLSLRGIGVDPVGGCDNDSQRWGDVVHGLTVSSPAAMAEQYGRDAAFIVSIWNSGHWYQETRRQLVGLGCRWVVPPSPIYWRFAADFLPYFALDLPHRVLAHRDRALEAFNLWSDRRSKQEYVRQLAWRVSGNWSFERPSRQDRESYFVDDLFDLTSDETFVDCGAFDGDTLRAYLAKRPDGFRRFVCIENDAATFAKLAKYVATLPASLGAKVQLHLAAVGTGDDSCASRIAMDEQQAGPTPLKVAISELAGLDEPTTFVKMDIEGAEEAALEGARSVIERDQPILAVCVYHRPEDLWRLPLLMHQMLPDHHMHLRCHEGDGWQTVAYAVPPHRSKQVQIQ